VYALLDSFHEMSFGFSGVRELTLILTLTSFDSHLVPDAEVGTEVAAEVAAEDGDEDGFEDMSALTL
jgi:hypothetical protein